MLSDGDITLRSVIIQYSRRVCCTSTTLFTRLHSCHPTFSLLPPKIHIEFYFHNSSFQVPFRFTSAHLYHNCHSSPLLFFASSLLSSLLFFSFLPLPSSSTSPPPFPSPPLSKLRGVAIIRRDQQQWCQIASVAPAIYHDSEL